MSPAPGSPTATSPAGLRTLIRRLLRPILPRTFQARLTLAFVGVVVLTLGIVSVLVINRVDDYFYRQTKVDLDARATTVLAVVVANIADVAGTSEPIVSPDGTLNATVVSLLQNPDSKRRLADVVGQANVDVLIGQVTRDSAGHATLVPSAGGTFAATRTARPRAGQAPDSITTETGVYVANPGAFAEYGIVVRLSDPYTFRASAVANVAGVLAIVGLIGLGLAVVVAALAAQRFTAPLRRLTDASRAIAGGDYSLRVPAVLARTGASEITELSRQFNAMAAQLGESVEIIRRDRDRSRDFLADVSHELRTPIAALRTFNELLREGADADPATRSEFLESSGQQLERLDWLAQNLLELSKLDSGLVLLDLRPDDLRACIESAVQQAEPAAARRGVSLRLDLPDDALRIQHDPQRIGQVVTNLVGNAIKFSSRGADVVVELRPHQDGARIVVRDTGVGIDPAEVPRIFERFFRGSRANEARGSGSGLGLAIVRSIVDMHGGRIAVESQVGVGTTFTVTLPSDPRKAEDAPPSAREAAASARGPDTARQPAARPLDMANPLPTDEPQLNQEPSG